MKLTALRSVLATAGAIAVGTVLAFALPAGAAVSVQSESPAKAAVSLGNRATLDANGAVVFAPVQVICPPGEMGYLSVAVTQNVDGFIASGERSVDVRCTGASVRVQVAVTPTQRAFRKGVAFGSARLHFCTSRCQTLVDEHTIQIVGRA